MVRGDAGPAVMRRVAVGAADRLAVVVASVNMGLFAVMAFTQWATWGGVDIVRQLGPSGQVVQDAVMVAAANLLFGAALVAAFFLCRPLDRRWPMRLLLAVVLSALVGLPRVWMLTLIPSVVEGDFYNLVDAAAGLAAGVVALLSACLVNDLVRRTQREERLRREQIVRAARTIAELEAEEAATRRNIAEQLHGHVQNRLVVVTAGLAGAAEDRRDADPDFARTLDGYVQALDEIREQDVRALSHDLFPVGADVSTVAAVMTLIDRLPVSMTGRLVVGELWERLITTYPGAAPMAERLIVVYTVEEALTNAIKHGDARNVEVRMDARPTGPDQWLMEVQVTDDGVGLAEGPHPFNGLARHAARLRDRGGSLDLTPGPDGRGTRLTLTLPFHAPETLQD